MQESQKIAKSVVKILDDARSKALALMTDDTMLNMAALGVDTTMTQLINRLRHQMGLPIKDEAANSIKFEELKPTVSNESLLTVAADASELEILLARAKEAADVIVHETNDVVLEKYRTNTEILALRALAKQNGVPDFDVAPIDEALIDAIRNAIAQNEETENLDAAAIIAQIEAAEDEETVKKLAALKNEDEQVQEAAMARMISLEK